MVNGEYFFEPGKRINMKLPLEPAPNLFRGRTLVLLVLY